MELLKEVLEKNKEKYLERLSELVAIDTHDLGHGIKGGLEKKGQDYIAELFRSMGAEVTLDPMKEEDIEKCFTLYQGTIRQIAIMFMRRFKEKRVAEA